LCTPHDDRSPCVHLVLQIVNLSVEDEGVEALLARVVAQRAGGQALLGLAAQSRVDLVAVQRGRQGRLAPVLQHGAERGRAAVLGSLLVDGRQVIDTAPAGIIPQGAGRDVLS